MSNKKVDLNEIQNPVKTLYTELDGDQVLLAEAKISTILIVRVEATFQDSLLGINLGADEIHRYLATNVPYEPFKYPIDNQTNSPYFEYKFYLSDTTKQYNRSVFNFLELTGILGGIFEIFDIGFGFIIGFISNYMFRKEIKDDINKANNQYCALKLMIDELKQEQKHKNQVSNFRMEHAEEEQKSSFLPKNNAFMNSRMQSELQSIKKISEYQHQKLDSFCIKDFNRELDGVNLVFTIKTLSKQVSYLLQKDEEYSQKITSEFEQQPDVYRRNLNQSLDNLVMNPSKNSPGFKIAPNNSSPNTLKHPPKSNFSNADFKVQEKEELKLELERSRHLPAPLNRQPASLMPKTRKYLYQMPRPT